MGRSGHLEVQREEGVVGEEAVAAGRCHEVAAEGCEEAVGAAQHRGRPVHQLIHIAAHAVERQVVCHLHACAQHSAPKNLRHYSTRTDC